VNSSVFDKKKNSELDENCGIMNLRVPRITHTELSYDKVLLSVPRISNNSFWGFGFG